MSANQMPLIFLLIYLRSLTRIWVCSCILAASKEEKLDDTEKSFQNKQKVADWDQTRETGERRGKMLGEVVTLVMVPMLRSCCFGK
jgi:hypothetical protein